MPFMNSVGDQSFVLHVSLSYNYSCFDLIDYVYWIFYVEDNRKICNLDCKRSNCIGAQLNGLFLALRPYDTLILEILMWSLKGNCTLKKILKNLIIIDDACLSSMK